MSNLIRVSVCVLMVVALSACGGAQDKDRGGADQDQKTGVANGPGIKVGTELPEIQLKDQNGKLVSVRELTRNSNVALVFYRSADW